MNQKITLFTAGVLTAAVVASVFAFSVFANPIPSQTSASPQNEVISDVVAAPNSESAAEQYIQQQQAYQAAAAERERMLKQQIADRQAVLNELDKSTQSEIELLQTQVVQLSDEINAKSLNVAELQAEIQTAQQAIEQDNLRYQNDLTTLQNTMIQTDASLRQQLEGTLGQLQAAYDEIAARQSASSSQSNSNNGDHHEDHDDDDHHEEHEHGEDHDDD